MMKKIIITSENYKKVFSKLEKFFYNNNIVYWHNFNCGGKKRIKPFNFRRYPERVVTSIKGDFFGIDFGENLSWHIKIGDTVSFIGNRIIVKSKWDIGEHKYIYFCFQIQ